MKIFLACAVATLLATPGYSVPKCDGHWTEYYNVGNPSRTGDDDESLAKIRKLHPGVCANPSIIDVRLVHPVLPGPGHDFWYLGRNHIEKHHRSEKFGFLCLGKLQQKYYKPKCQDYKVRFCCSYPEPSCPPSYSYWTGWFDRDDPSATGDYETLSDLRKENPGKICHRPFNIQAQLVSGKPYQIAGEKVTISAKQGFYCRRKDQKDNQCHDYQVRFCCEKEPKCPTSYAYWTNWFDRDNPTVTGDYETLSDLRKENRGKICHKPINVHAQLVSGEPYQYAGEKVTINRHEGFYCKKEYQKDNKCEDYRVRFCCGKEPSCPSKTHRWTQWFDRDNPSVTGDYETLSDLRKENPGKICHEPTNVHAQLVTGEPYQFAEEKVTINTKDGFYCKKKDQKDNSCHDYKVRFCCPIPPPVIRYWTDWCNVDSPYKGKLLWKKQGDFETVANLRAAGKKFCKNPLKIQAVRVRDHVDATKTGERISAYNTRVGFICYNYKQRRTNRYRPPVCSDYKVRFYCEKRG